MANELKEHFERASQFLRDLPKDIKMTDQQKLRSYGLYKQATIGDVNTSRPGMFSMVERAKWDAWKECEGMDMEAAEQAYIELVDDIYPGWAEK
mmetsp:Transcript_5603/g.8534  ORF Transcript_5603/g.8534 Transcript_5603/m.8534 type:complete len:94 (-) Transcript_5603:142-423(-)|eukprot:CAMPEP_0185018112 /NCGR_PEP_ID=MMETSP1103-20130426/948_1 /TAXON_ID=36769 /ORGANISM="Paraphysomonas bandaiensis, Strain Caron Lab Isolate" /LENGTH=93 /DNA_ID=CAMNT_0027547825 /DNA_START=44 /DNA_END=325 /DNA_ORIENTATION=+